MPKCSQALRAEGKSYPRTCAECGLGPCKYLPIERWPNLHPDPAVEAFNALKTEVNLLSGRVDLTLRLLARIIGKMDPAFTEDPHDPDVKRRSDLLTDTVIKKMRQDALAQALNDPNSSIDSKPTSRTSPMSDQPAHPIIITYLEGDNGKNKPFSALTYIEWTEGPRSYYAHADESQFDYGENPTDAEGNELDEKQDAAGNWEHRGIPLRVRRALAALIFPPLDLSDAARYNGSEYATTCPHCGTKFGVN